MDTNKQKEQDKKEVALLIHNYREAWKTKAARTIIWDILSYCGVYNSSFTGNSQTFHLEGKRDVGLFILERIQEMDKTAYARLILEQQEEIN